MRAQRLTLVLALVGLISPTGAQWLNYPAPGTPLKTDGTVDLTARAPRALDGKPDLSGVWRVQPPKPGEIERLYGKNEVSAVAGDDWAEFDRHFMDLFIDFRGGESPLSAEAIAETQRRRQSGQLDPFNSPSARCLPMGFLTQYFHFRPFKFFQTPQELVMYFEMDGVFRQIHTDGRKLPESPFPSWMGYSTGKWVGDSLVVDTTGFNDQWRLDAMGHPNSDQLRFREVFHRRDFGHLDIDATVEDPVMLTKPVNIKFTLELMPNTDMLESYCVDLDQSFVRGQPK